MALPAKPNLSRKAALVVLPRGFPNIEGQPTSLVLTVFLDLLANLISASGLTTIVIGAERAALTVASEIIPAGIDVADAASPASALELERVISSLEAREFEQFVCLAADTIPLPARIVTTAFSALGSASVVFGSTPAGSLYLSAFMASRIGEPWPGLRWQHALWTGEQHNQATYPSKIKLEKLSRLSDRTDLTSIIARLSYPEKLLPRTMRLLTQIGPFQP